MRFGFLAFALLSILVLSFGINNSVFAENDDTPISVLSDSDIIANGGIVTISGDIQDYDPQSLTAGAITLLIKSPDNNIVGIGQQIPNSDGSYQFSFVAGGNMWKSGGDYTVMIKYGADKSEIMVNYVGGEPVISEPPVVPVPPVVPEPPVVPVPPVVPEPPVVPVPPVAPEPSPDNEIVCGPGTEKVDGVCTPIMDDTPPPSSGSCLVATAAYGTELAPQVQFLREVRDNTVLSTASGMAFMNGFNTVYYSFAPTVADWERENPAFQKAVKVFITPMISSLSIMALADEGSEVDVLGLGLSVIALNLGMYIAVPALIGFKIHNRIKSRK